MKHAFRVIKERIYLKKYMSKLSSMEHCSNENSLLLVIHGFLGLSGQNQDIFQMTGTKIAFYYGSPTMEASGNNMIPQKSHTYWRK
jgi:hypothetical protein